MFTLVDTGVELLIRKIDSDVVVMARGELDLRAAQPLEAVLLEACCMHDGDVVVDFSAVTFCDAAALGQLEVAAARLARRGCRLTVRHVPPRQVKVFRLAGLERLLEDSSDSR